MVKKVESGINVGVIVNKGFEKAAVVQIRELLESVKDITVQDTLVHSDQKLGMKFTDSFTRIKLQIE